MLLGPDDLLLRCGGRTGDGIHRRQGLIWAPGPQLIGEDVVRNGKEPGPKRRVIVPVLWKGGQGLGKDQTRGVLGLFPATESSEAVAVDRINIGVVGAANACRSCRARITSARSSWDSGPTARVLVARWPRSRLPMPASHAYPMRLVRYTEASPKCYKHNPGIPEHWGALQCPTPSAAGKLLNRGGGSPCGRRGSPVSETVVCATVGIAPWVAKVYAGTGVAQPMVKSRSPSSGRSCVARLGDRG